MTARARGFSLLELAVVILVLAVLGGSLLRALWRYEGQVERQAVDMTVRQIRTGLHLRLLDAMTYGRREDIASLPGSNPILLRGAPAENYLGELSSPPAPELTGWYFDTVRRELAYRPRSESFAYRDGEHGELRWQLRQVKESEIAVRFQEAGVGVP